MVKVKGEVHPRTGYEVPEGEERYSSTLSLASTLEGGGWSTPHSSCCIPGIDPVPIVQKTGWGPGWVWTDLENLAHTGIRSQDRPVRSESLYQLSYPSPRYNGKTYENWVLRQVVFSHGAGDRSIALQIGTRSVDFLLGQTRGWYIQKKSA